MFASLRQTALAIFQAGVAAADPYLAVQRHLSVDDRGYLQIQLDDGCLLSRHWSSVQLLAVGKAACAMTKAAQEIIPASLLKNKALAITNYENVVPLPAIRVLGARHPLPDAAGLAAAQLLAQELVNTRTGELVLVLVSGGGSALIPYPVSGITLQEKILVTKCLLACGAPIHDINCVRKHLSQLKGGGLARLAAPADVHALILSDVLGDDLSVIASGITVADDSTFAEAINILKNRQIWLQIPKSVQSYLQAGSAGKVPETPKANDSLFTHNSHTLIGSNRISVNAMMATAEHCGYSPLLFSDNLSGEARTVAEQIVLFAKTINQPTALLAGGETTVTLTGNGSGGRNQEMALAFAIAAQQHQLNGNWVFLSGGTDGLDGPTPAAGGMVDPQTLQRMQQHTVNPVAMLANNDSFHALQLSDDLLVTGATGTNVADLQILLIRP